MKYIVHVAVMAALVGGGCGGGGSPPVGIYTVTPERGPAAGGTAITISGWGFAAGATVQVGGAAASAVAVVDANTITCNTPSHGTNEWVTVEVTVGTDVGGKANAFYYYVPPNITSVNPTSGPSAGGTLVTITGTGFLTGATVTFGTAAASSVTVVNSTTITCLSPAVAVSGAVDVTVTNADTGTDTLLGAFTYRLPPNITAVAPSYAETAGGATITITGSQFYGTTANTTVMIGTNSLSPATVNPTQITFVVPTGLAAGTYDITVVNPDNQTDVAPLALELYQSGQIIVVNDDTGNDTTGNGTFATPYRTIGKGIQAATAGKLVLVLDGTYDTESFPVAMKAGVSVAGESTGGTVVDGNATAGSIFSFNAITGQPTVLKRMTVTGAHPDTGTGVVIGNSDSLILLGLEITSQSRGVDVSSSTITIDRCNIRLNLKNGGLVAFASDVTALDTVFEGNTEDDSPGAGAYIDAASTVLFDGCEFVNNDATVGSFDKAGGGIAIEGTGTIKHCVFRGNRAAMGGGIVTIDVPDTAGGEPQLFIKNCIFYQNTAVNPYEPGRDGAALAVGAFYAYNMGTEIDNCVFDDNTSGASGCTILGYVTGTYWSHPVLRNCVISGSNANGYYCNSNRGNPGLFYNDWWDNTANHVLLHTLAYNTEATINNTTSGIVPVFNAGNIVRAPGFVDDAARNYHLAAGSNCIDMGDPATAYNDPDGSRNDIGAYGGPDGNW